MNVQAQRELEEEQRRNFGRWIVMRGLYNAKPIGLWEEVLLSILRGMWADATSLELRRALDYLSDRKVIDLEKKPNGRWYADLNRYGVDIVERQVPCEPGIDRPETY